MTADEKTIRRELQDCLGRHNPAGDLVECVARNFPQVEVYREMDDLVVKGGSRYLIVRRVDGDIFRVSENAWAPTTNLVDFGGGAERTLDELVREIAALAQ